MGTPEAVSGSDLVLIGSMSFQLRLPRRACGKDERTEREKKEEEEDIPLLGSSYVTSIRYALFLKKREKEEKDL